MIRRNGIAMITKQHLLSKIMVPCAVEQGMFSREWLCHVQAGGKVCHGMVDKDFVIDGKIATELWREFKDHYIVVLPGEFFNSLVSVKKSDVEVRQFKLERARVA